MSSRTPPTIPTIAAAAAVALAPFARGQGEPPATPPPGDVTTPPPVRASDPTFKFDVTALFEHQFSATLDRGGELEVDRYTAGVTFSTELSRDVGLSASFEYSFDDFNFEGPTGAFGASAPWEGIHTYAFTARATFEVDNKWSVFVGPVVQCARESGADFDDGWTAGGFGGAFVRAGPDLIVGGGIGIVTELQDDMRLYPIIVLEWEINDDLHLTSTGGASGGRGGALELVYALGDDWEAGIGGGYRFSRFRLDADGLAPNGVGEETNYPFWSRLGFRSGGITVNGYFGWSFSGEIELEQPNRVSLGAEGYESTIVVGLSASIRF